MGIKPKGDAKLCHLFELLLDAGRSDEDAFDACRAAFSGQSPVSGDERSLLFPRLFQQLAVVASLVCICRILSHHPQPPAKAE
jgi:hypothetical protein